jgi:hypothetical protein
MQASDRRLTDARTGRLIDDHSNKAVVWGGAATFAFTGLASIGSERADVWIAKQIREADDLPNGLLALCKAGEANSAIRGHALAAVGVGVVHNPHEKKDGRERLMPTVCWAGNCLTEQGGPAQVRKQWTFGGRWARDEPFLLHVAGQRLYEDERAALEARLDRKLQAGEPPSAIARCLVDAIRAVADDRSTAEHRKRANTVGKGIQITCVPYAVIGPLPVGKRDFALFIPDGPLGLGGFTVGEQNVMFAAEPRLDGYTFMYVPPHVDRGIWRGPTSTWPRGMVLTDFKTRLGSIPQGPPEPADVSAVVTVAATAP